VFIQIGGRGVDGPMS